MDNPFLQIAERLSNIESLLLDIKHRPTNPAPAAPADEVLNLKQAAELLDLKPETVYQLVHERKIPFSKPNGRRLYFSRAELTAWVKDGRKRTATEIAAEASQHVTRKRPARANAGTGL